MTKRGPLLLLLCLLVAATVSVSTWQVVRASHDAMAKQVRAGEELAASERAQALGHAIASADERLDELAGRAGRLKGMPRDQQLGLALDILMAQTGAVSAGIVQSDGTVLASVGGAADAPGDGAPVFHPASGERGATVVLSAPVTMPDSDVPAVHIMEELLLAELAPGFEQPFAQFAGATSLVQRDGTLVMSTAKPMPVRIPTDDLLDLVATGEPGFIEYYSERFESDRVGVTHPVAGTDLVVVVSADASSVAEPASALVRDLLVVFVAAAAAVATLITGIVLLTRRSHRRLSDAAALAMVDPLTGLTNRRGLDAQVASVRAAAVLAVDVDGLKLLNDTHGHAAGDRAIVLVARALQSAVRADDIVARVGGDEFVVVMPGATPERAERAVRSIALALADDELRVSTGIATTSSGSFADALARADADLYVCKRRRREVVLT